ncbi:low-specificity L-threonine aldolase [Salinicola acroporae]|uniref:Low-specificity L-threonine aldolase n=1 Tax=Salinicola acroporae TaxID=1541440 RepID=A0ABT6IA21_9GAMM|nr:low-specificity L-threonine aldolase [Salinicola acroporae]MDH4574378.1 low-specificity L-threonine aldolase [Salinicola acroporae]
MIDLRSDTVTRPSEAMRQVMFDAPLGDDVWGDDPSVARLEAYTAERTGKAAALFFPSGTQSNLVALLSHCQRGDEYIVGQQAHTYRMEGGGAAVLGGIQPQPIENEADGTLPLKKIEAAVKPIDPHFARTRLLTLENTFHGQVLDAGYVEAATSLARRFGLATHLDGARIGNAAAATGASLKSLCSPFDTISICCSKGLGAPAGSVLVGAADFIETARRWRKVVGGGMRQVGMLAAACEYALAHQLAPLVEDHAKAERLAAGLAEIDGITVTAQATNMVFVEFTRAALDPADLHAWLKARDILVGALYAPRFVTHRDVSMADIDRVVDVVGEYFRRG